MSILESIFTTHVSYLAFQRFLWLLIDVDGTLSGLNMSFMIHAVIHYSLCIDGTNNMLRKAYCDLIKLGHNNMSPVCPNSLCRSLEDVVAETKCSSFNEHCIVLKTIWNVN